MITKEDLTELGFKVTKEHFSGSTDYQIVYEYLHNRHELEVTLRHGKIYDVDLLRHDSDRHASCDMHEILFPVKTLEQLKQFVSICIGKNDYG